MFNLMGCYDFSCHKQKKKTAARMAKQSRKWNRR